MQTIFESADVVKLVGISPSYLNKFVERGLYGITPSERAEVGRGKRRWFNSEDVLGIALVWWLFEAGLRSEVIRRVLREFFEQKEADANRAAKALSEDGPDFLVVRRVPRSGEGKRLRYPKQTVEAVNKSELIAMIEKGETEALQVVPVGKLIRNLEERIALESD